jgi:hypothetical protein
VPIAMAATELEARRLVRLAGPVWPAFFAYDLVYPEASTRRPKIAAFRELTATIQLFLLNSIVMRRTAPS